MTAVAIRRPNQNDQLALYRHYDGETEPQPCFLALDLEDGWLWADYNPEVGSGGTPEEVVHGRVHRWTIPCLTSQAAAKLLEQVRPLAQQILDGATIESDGSNMVGHLDEDALAASDQIGEGCDALFEPDGAPLVEEVDFNDWHQASDTELGVTTSSTDADLEAIAKQLTEDSQVAVESGGVLVLWGVDDYLRNVRSKLQDQKD
jgi:hypothetical protein